MKKNTILVLFVLVLVIVAPLSTYAKENEREFHVGDRVKTVLSITPKASPSGEESFKDSIKEKLQQLKDDLKGGVHIENGVVTAINGATLTVTKDSLTYTVTTTDSTKYRRHFWGNASFKDIQVNDKVNVWGKHTGTDQTSIEATMIRDLSEMKKYGVFFGNVVSKTSDHFVMQSKERGTQTVYFTPTTKFINRKEQSMTYDQIQVNDRVRVRGVWDKTNNNVTDVTQVKNFTQPQVKNVKPTGTVTPTVSVTTAPTTAPTVTPTHIPTPTPTTGAV